MLSLPTTIDLPLRMDDHGSIHVSNTRITLDTVIARHLQGDSPEAIHEGFPTIPLADLYAVIAYYVAQHDAIDDYLARRTTEAETRRREVESRYSPEQRQRTEHFRNLLQQKHKNERS